MVKGPGVSNLALIDTHHFGSTGVLRISCAVEPTASALLIRVARYYKLSELVLEVKKRSPKGDPKSQQFGTLSVLCPITGKLMKNPGKGKNCQHGQCFDLKPYMKRCTMARNWLCPICHMSATVNDLWYSYSMAECIARARRKVVAEVFQEGDGGADGGGLPY
jgi:hypothetical protein